MVFQKVHQLGSYAYCFDKVKDLAVHFLEKGFSFFVILHLYMFVVGVSVIVINHIVMEDINISHLCIYVLWLVISYAICCLIWIIFLKMHICDIFYFVHHYQFVQLLDYYLINIESITIDVLFWIYVKSWQTWQINVDLELFPST